MTNYDHIKKCDINALAVLLTDLAVDVLSKPDWYHQNLGLYNNTLMKQWLEADIFEKIGEMGI